MLFWTKSTDTLKMWEMSICHAPHQLPGQDLHNERQLTQWQHTGLPHLGSGFDFRLWLSWLIGFYPQGQKKGILVNSKVHVYPPTHILSDQGDMLVVILAFRTQVICTEGKKLNRCPTNLTSLAWSMSLGLMLQGYFNHCSPDCLCKSDIKPSHPCLSSGLNQSVTLHSKTCTTIVCQCVQ